MPVMAVDRDDLRPTVRQRAGLVEDQRSIRAIVSSGPAPLISTRMRRAGQARD